MLDFPDGQSDLGAVFVDVGDGFGAPPDVTGQEFVGSAVFRILGSLFAAAAAVSTGYDLNDVV